MMSEHSAQLSSLPFGICTWLWRYTCLLLLISMLWHRQAIFESKGDKLSNRKYQPYPLLSYFSMVVCQGCLLIHILSLNYIYIPENWEFVFIIIVQFTISANRWIPFALANPVHLFVHYTISLSSLCKLICRHCTYKMPVGYILSSV